MSAPPEIIAPRHVERFQCIGSACEDDCCHGWRVSVDRDHARRFLKVLDSPVERDRFRDAIEVQENWATNPQAYAILKRHDDGRCVYLDEDRLCGVQKRHGGDVLWDTCATYPRLFGRTGNRLEVWAAPSCPEVARQLLLHDDAIDLVALDRSHAVRTVLQHDIAIEPTRAYERYLDDIRVTALRVLGTTRLSLGERLYLLMRLGDRTSAFFHRDAQTVDERRLADELTLVTHPDVHEIVRASFAELPEEHSAVVRLLLGILGQELKNQYSMGFGGLVKDVLRPAAAVGTAPGENSMTIDVSTLTARYDERRDAWQAAQGERLDRYFVNYSSAYWMREWYTHSPNLAVHGRRLLLRLALLRLLLLCHPKLDGVDPRAADAGSVLDATAVDACYRLGRGLDHNVQLIEPIDRALASGDVERLEKQLLRF